MKNLILIVMLPALLFVASPVLADKNSATSAVAQAQTLIRSAERSGAETMASADLKTARDLLNSAQAHLGNRDWEEAEFAAWRSQRDAEVAAARSQALKAEQAQAELQSVVDTLRRELNLDGEQQ